MILCASKDDEVVEYAVNRTMSPMMVAEYHLQLPDKKILQKYQKHDGISVNRLTSCKPISNNMMTDKLQKKLNIDGFNIRNEQERIRNKIRLTGQFLLKTVLIEKAIVTLSKPYFVGFDNP